MIFQSTLPREERQRYTFFIPSQLIAFQSTLPREERPSAGAATGSLAKFQSTLPREERQAGDTYTDIMYIDFNPRSHERSDHSQKSWL